VSLEHIWIPSWKRSWLWENEVGAKGYGLGAGEENSETLVASMDKRAGLLAANTQHPTPNTQSWWCLSIAVPHEAAETVASFLIELGSEGVIESERDLTQPASPFTTVQGFFPLTRPTEELQRAVAQHLQQLRREFSDLNEVKPQISEITSDAWAGQWRGHFPPLLVGQRFLVLPPWESSAAWPERIPLIIDPSLAFGTGHHATTQGCLEAIESICLRDGPPARAFDLGTGSGILAIALAKLGTPNVWATDNDPIALEEAQKNATTNHVRHHLHLSDVEVAALPVPFPLLVANLFSSTLIALAPILSTAAPSRGYAILSGIQLDQEADVIAAYTAPLWQLITRYPKEEWVTLVIQRT